MRTFFSDHDYRLYLHLLSQKAEEHQLEVWAFCLMPNHVHLIAVPWRQDSLERTFGRTHQQYATRVNAREGWRGHLWQERFYSMPMDERHLMNAVSYVLWNPVRAKIAGNAREWQFSSVEAHLGEANPFSVVNVDGLAARSYDWERLLRHPPSPENCDEVRKKTSSGRPLGSTLFVEKLEKMLGRPLSPKKRGPKPRAGRRG